MARVTPRQVTERRDALLAQDAGRRVIVLEPDPVGDDVECYAIKDGKPGDGPRWTEHSFASAGTAYGLGGNDDAAS